MTQRNCTIRILMLFQAALLVSACEGTTNTVLQTEPHATEEGELAQGPALWEKRRANDPQLAGVLTRLEAGLKQANIAGAGFAVVKNGRLYFAGGVGLREPGGTQAVDAHTLFRVASVSKPIAAMTMLSLQDSRQVSLDKPITDYAPSFKLLPPHQPSQIRVADLIGHTAGLPDGYIFNCKSDTAQAIEENFAAIPNLTQRNPAGVLYNYSNFNFNVAGLVAQKAGGKSYRQLVSERVFGPAGMVDSTYDPEVVRRSNNFAKGTAAGENPFDSTFTNCSLSDGSGGAYSSAYDLGKLAEQVLRGGGKVLSRQAMQTMISPRSSTQTPVFVSYGYGMFSQPFRGTFLTGHSGDFPGFHAAWFMLPAFGFGVAVIVNGDGYDPQVAALDAMKSFNTLADIPLPDTRTPAEAWQEFAGIYVDPIEPDAFPAGVELGAMKFEVENGKPYFTLLQEEPPVRRELTQFAMQAFAISKVENYPFTFVFHRDGTGKPQYMAERTFGVGKRIDEQHMPLSLPKFSKTEALRRLELNFSRVAEEPWIRPELLK
jgi:CubicO group peptidase (beta-lactamase class C family)